MKSLRRLLRLAMAGWPVLAVAGESASPVEMDAVEVRAAREYRALEPDWLRADVPGFTVYARHGVGGPNIAKTLSNVRTGLSVVWSNPRALALPFKVVVCGSEMEFFAWTGATLADRDRAVRKVATPVGPVLVINGSVDFVQEAVGRAYAFALLEESGLPSWLREGIAQIVKSVEVEKDRVRVGVVKLNEPELVSSPRLRQLREIARMIMTEDLTGLREAGIAVDETEPFNRDGTEILLRNGIMINGQTTSAMQLEDYCATELNRRLKARTVHAPEAEFFSYFTEEPLVPLARVFDTQTSDSVEWRMTAWAFVHLALFGEKQQYRPAFVKFVQALEQQSQRPAETLFAECFGLSIKKFMPRLAGYTRRGSYAAPEYRVSQDVMPPPAPFSDSPEAEILALKARTWVAGGRLESARALLERGYANPANRTMAYVLTLAELAPEADAARALERIDRLVGKEKPDARGYRTLGKLRLKVGLATDGRLDERELADVLVALEQAVESGDRSEEVFALLGRTWLASPSPRAHPTQIETLQIARQRYPRSSALAELTRKLQEKRPAPDPTPRAK